MASVGSRRSRQSVAGHSVTRVPPAPTRSNLRRQTTALANRPSLLPSLTDSSDAESTARYALPTRFGEPLHGDLVDEELDERLVLDQVTPRPLRRLPGPERGDPDTTQTALDRFRARQMRGERVSRASMADDASIRTRTSANTRSTRPSRQSEPGTSASARTTTRSSGRQSFFTAGSRSAASRRLKRRPLDVSETEEEPEEHEQVARRKQLNEVDEDDEDDDGTADVTVSRPGQRLRPSLSSIDGRLDIPTIEERCAALVINAKGVLHFYMDLYDKNWQPESFDDMMRNWAPFESYKTNQLLAESQYNHHFIDVEEVMRSLRQTGQIKPAGFQEAMKMANCATFVHYIHQLPMDPALYGRRDGRSISLDDVLNAPLRNISELNDARRIFLRWILPFDWPLTDEVLNMLLDMSIQIFIHRLQRIVDMLEAGEVERDRAESIIYEDLDDLMSGDVVRHSLQRVKSHRQMTRADIRSAVQRYETFANMQSIVLKSMLNSEDMAALRAKFAYPQMAADLTSYVRDVVREVDAGMHSTTLPQIINRLARESSIISSSDVPEFLESSSLYDEPRLEEGSGDVLRPSQSTPKASRIDSTQPSQPFASQYVSWLDEMMDAADTQAVRRPSQRQGVSRGIGQDVDLSVSQRLQELEELYMEDTEDQAEDRTHVPGRSKAAARLARESSLDIDVPSSPPGARNTSSARLSTTVTQSRNRRSLVVPLVSDQSEETDSASRAARDEMADSPAKQKASRLGFDSQNRLVRRQSNANRQGRLLDGSGEAVRESRFDSQGEEEEDIFLDRAVRGAKRPPTSKAKGKQRALDPPEVGTVRGTDATSSGLTASNVPNRLTDDQLEDEQPQTARRTGSRSASVRRLQMKSESVSPAKLQAQHRQVEALREAASNATSDQHAQNGPTLRRSKRHKDGIQKQAEASSGLGAADLGERLTRSSVAQSQAAQANLDVTTGIGRGRPGGDAEAANRIVSTASGRLIEEGQEGEEDENSRSEGSRPAFRAGDAEIGAARASPDDDFLGDEDSVVQARRAALDAAIADRQTRPGTLQFTRPPNDASFPDIGHEQDDLNVNGVAARDVENVRAVLRESDAVNHRRIGPYRPEQIGGRRRVREEPEPSYEEDEIDELEDEGGSRPTPRQRRRRFRPNDENGVRVEPYKRSNLYVTGHNMTGRQQWSPEEVECLLSALHQLARYKKISPKFKVYAEVLKRHGPFGSESNTLARWNNVQLKDKSRNELIRMKREGQRIPYWKRLLHPNIWEPKRSLVSREARDATEDVPDADGADLEDSNDPIENVQEEAQDDAVEAVDSEDQAETSAALAVDGADTVDTNQVIVDIPMASLKSSNPLQNVA